MYSINYACSKIMKNAAQQGFSEKLPGVLKRVVSCAIINPRRMCEGYGSRFCVCVCVCVCYRASCYIPRLYVQSEAS